MGGGEVQAPHGYTTAIMLPLESDPDRIQWTWMSSSESNMAVLPDELKIIIRWDITTLKTLRMGDDSRFCMTHIWTTMLAGGGIELSP